MQRVVFCQVANGWEFRNVGLRGRWENYRHSWREDRNQNLTERPNDVDTKRPSLNGMNFLLKINAVKAVLHEAIFPATYNAIPLRSKLLTKIARVTRPLLTKSKQ